MSDQRSDAVELADDIAKKTAKVARDKVRSVTSGLDFDLEPNSFLVALDELAEDDE